VTARADLGRSGDPSTLLRAAFADAVAGRLDLDPPPAAAGEDRADADADAVPPPSPRRPSPFLRKSFLARGSGLSALSSFPSSFPFPSPYHPAEVDGRAGVTGAERAAAAVDGRAPPR
jgi:hypothetical protein